MKAGTLGTPREACRRSSRHCRFAWGHRTGCDAARSSSPSSVRAGPLSQRWPVASCDHFIQHTGAPPAREDALRTRIVRPVTITVMSEVERPLLISGMRRALLRGAVRLLLPLAGRGPFRGRRNRLSCNLGALEGPLSGQPKQPLSQSSIRSSMVIRILPRSAVFTVLKMKSQPSESRIVIYKSKFPSIRWLSCAGLVNMRNPMLGIGAEVGGGSHLRSFVG